MKPKELTQEELKRKLSYDPHTGAFTYRVDHPVGRFKAGQPAGGVNNKGYVRLSVNDVSFTGQRLAWLYMTGEWPKGQVDHIDGCRTNNRWSNLRDVSASVNRQNMRVATKRNRSGLLGVSLSTTPGKFNASIYVQKKLKHLGVFDTPEAAHSAYLTAKRELHEGSTL